MVHSVSIVGCGYTGRRLAERLLKSGLRVYGFATRAESLRQIAAAGAEALPLDLDKAIAPIDFTGQLIYYMVPPAPHTGDLRLNRFLDALLGAPKRFVYLSTTGVYGDQGGARVSEDTPPDPCSARAVRRLAAENALRVWAESHRVSWCVLRVSGIYGPGRLPIDRLRGAVPAVHPEEATPSSRIHVTDLVTACAAAGSCLAADQRIYNITDGSDHSLTEYLRRVAAIARLPLPPLASRAEVKRAISPLSWSFLAESRRVDNSRMLEELGVALKFQDLDAGIRQSLEESPLG